MEQIKVRRVHSHTPDTPPDGWCVVFRGRTVEAGPFKDKSEASMKMSSLVDYNHIFNYGNLQLRFGTKETDGSDDFIPGTTPATDSTVTAKKVNMNKMKLRDFLTVNQQVSEAEKKASVDLIRLAANCGIDARGMTPKQISDIYNKNKDPQFQDQHDMRLQAALKKELKESVLNEWIPDKESLVYFEKMAKLQKRIWSDSIDVGVLVDDAKKKEAREHLITLMDTYGSKLSKWETGSTTKVFIPIEHDEGGLAGTLLEVSYNEIKTRGSLLDKSSTAKGFISIELSRKVLSSKEAKEKYGARTVDESVESGVVGPF